MAASAKVFLERGTTKIQMSIRKVDEAVSNKVIKLVYPQVGSQSDNANQIKSKDLKRIDFSYTLEGNIESQIATVDGGSVLITPAQAKNLLIYKIIYGTGDLNFYWTGLAVSDLGQSGGTALSSVDETNVMEATDTDRKTTCTVELLRSTHEPRRLKETSYTTVSGADIRFPSNAYTVDEFNAQKYGVQIRLFKSTSF